ncbi:putative ribonuclease H-like domain-containing protein [Tanacetum coccineum]|uniref:Ribonuclease H-like domain-containing protein n=1 Tax=Tanacetum coccineum TaxID=301880 RepID=A0ABQ5F423_9ASTR
MVAPSTRKWEKEGKKHKLYRRTLGRSGNFFSRKCPVDNNGYVSMGSSLTYFERIVCFKTTVGAGTSRERTEKETQKVVFDSIGSRTYEWIILQLKVLSNVKGNGPDWLFDVDSLSISMNYVPVAAGNKTNGIAGTKDNIVAGQAQKEKEPEQEYILIPLCTTDPLISQGPKDCEGDAGMKPTEVDENEASDKSGKHDQEARSESERLNQREMQTEHTNSSNGINTVSTPVSTAGPSFDTVVPSTPVNTAGPSVSTANESEEQLFERFSPFKNAFTLPPVPNISSMDNTGIFGNAYDDEDVEEEVDMNNVISSYTVPDTSFTKFHKDHPEDQVIGSLKTPVQTRHMTKITEEHGLFSSAIGTKWVFRNKKDERGIVVKKKARLVAQGHIQEEGIYYDEVFAPVARIKAIRLFLAYASFKDFVVYQMDVKSAFLYGKIEEEVYVCQPPGFEDLHFPDKVYKKSDGIFISQDKYVAEILKKFDFTLGKTASTPIETNKALIKDEEAEDVDVHLYRSMIGSLMYLTASRPDIMFVVCACARFQVTPKTSHFNAMKMIFRYLKGQPKLGLWYTRDSPFDFEAFSDSDYAGASLDRKSTTGGFSISWQEIDFMAIQVLWIQNQMLDYRFNFINTKIYIDNESTICIVKNLVFHSKTKHIEIRYHFIRDSYEKKLIQVIKIHTDQNVADLLTKAFDASRVKTAKVGDEAIHKELGDRMERAATTASSLEAEQGSSGPSTSKNEEMEITTTIDGRFKTITEASIRRHLKLEDSYGIPTLPNAEIFEQLALMGDEGSLTLNELTVLCTTLSKKVEDLQNDLKQTKLTYGAAYTKLILRVKKLEHKVKASKSRRRARVIIFDNDEYLEDSYKQGRIIAEIDQNPSISLVQDEGTSWIQEDVETQGRTSVDTEILLEKEEPTELVEDPGSGEKGEKEISTAEVLVSTAILERQVYIKRSAEKRKDKGKAIMKDDESIDIARQEQEKYDLAQALELQKELDKRKEDVPETTQAHDIDWSDPVGGYKQSHFIGMSYEDIRPIFERVWDQNQAFVPKDSEIEKEEMKRPGFDLQQKQPTEEEKLQKNNDSSKPSRGSRKKTLAMKKASEKQIEEFAMDVESLSTKYPIVYWKTHILTENFMYYQIIKADGSSKNYKIFSEIIDDFDRQVDGLHKPYLSLEEDEVWRNQHGYNLISWRLIDSCGIHILLMDNGIAIHMMVEKKYPLIQEML